MFVADRELGFHSVGINVAGFIDAMAPTPDNLPYDESDADADDDFIPY